jgi:uncharacterized OB-fold protein
VSAALAQALPADRVRITTDPYTEPFWQAAKDDRLVAPACGACGTFRMPPTPFCPHCRSEDVDWRELSGRGTVYSFSVVHGYPGIPDITLVAAVVELPDAPDARLVTNVVDVDPAEVHIGDELEVLFSPISDGWKVPLFRLARPAT